MPINVYLATDYALLAGALEQCLGSEPRRFRLAGCADPQAISADKLAALGVDVIVLDMDCLGHRALPLLSRLRDRSHAKALLITRIDDSDLLDKAVMHGARGIINRQGTLATLLTAIEKVHEGQLWLDRTATGRIFVEFLRHAGTEPRADGATGKLMQLTEREHQIVTFIAHNDGDPGKVIADKLNISESTLRNHLTSIYEKLGVANRPGLLAYARQNGLAAPSAR